MKAIHLLAGAIAITAAAMLNACSADDSADSQTTADKLDMKAVVSTTRYTNDTLSYGAKFDIDDSIGVILVRNGHPITNVIQESKLNLDVWLCNEEFKIKNLNGDFISAIPDREFFWPGLSEMDNIDAYAYYPYQPGLADAPVSLSVNTDQRTGQPGELLRAKRIDVKHGEPIYYIFHRTMSLVEVKMTKAQLEKLGVPDKDLTLNGFTPSYTATVTDPEGQVTATGTPQPILMQKVPDPQNPANVIFRAAVPPQTIAAQTPMFQFTDDNGTVTDFGKYYDDIDLPQDKHLTIDLTKIPSLDGELVIYAISINNFPAGVTYTYGDIPTQSGN